MVSSQHAHFLHFIADVLIMPPPTHPPTHPDHVNERKIERSKICMKILLKLLKMRENWAADLRSPPPPPPPASPVRSYKTWCVFQDSGTTLDAKQANLVDLYLTKYWGMKFATAAACTVLRVDQVSTPSLAHILAAPFHCCNTAKLLFPL